MRSSAALEAPCADNATRLVPLLLPIRSLVPFRTVERLAQIVGGGPRGVRRAFERGRAHIPALREAGLPAFLNTILLLHAIGRRRSAGGWEEAAQMGKKSVRTLDRQVRQLFGCGLRDLEHRDMADLMAQARTLLLPPPVT